jgi:hypothetical protein
MYILISTGILATCVSCIVASALNRNQKRKIEDKKNEMKKMNHFSNLYPQNEKYEKMSKKSKKFVKEITVMENIYENIYENILRHLSTTKIESKNDNDDSGENLPYRYDIDFTQRSKGDPNRFVFTSIYIHTDSLCWLSVF